MLELPSEPLIMCCVLLGANKGITVLTRGESWCYIHPADMPFNIEIRLKVNAYLRGHIQTLTFCCCAFSQRAN